VATQWSAAWFALIPPMAELPALDAGVRHLAATGLAGAAPGEQHVGAMEAPVNTPACGLAATTRFNAWYSLDTLNVTLVASTFRYGCWWWAFFFGKSVSHMGGRGATVGGRGMVWCFISQPVVVVAGSAPGAG
jgi:hypothetical protein